VRYLLDTHALLWIANEDAKLSETAKSLFLDENNAMLCSLASIWELAIKISIGKISLDEPLESFIDHHVSGNDIDILPIQKQHILPLQSLPFHHKDPFDRLIIAQAMVEKIPIISKDLWFDSYPVHRVW